MNVPTITIIGDVDNGKSTLIGSLLIQTKSVAKGLIKKAQDFCKNEGIGFEPAYLVDYIREEREMKSTREWALAEFKLGRDKIQIIDTPGQMTLSKKMVSGLTQANIIILILDIKEENYPKYRYYLNLLSFLDIKNAIIVVNKLDLVDYKKSEFLLFLSRLKKEVKGFANLLFPIIPVSSLRGDMLTRKSAKLRWYKGKTLVENLKRLVVLKNTIVKDAIFPIQDVVGGTKVLGKLLCGALKNNQKMGLVKGGRELEKIKIEGIYHLGKKSKILLAGQNGELILEANAKRGDIIAEAKNIQRINKITARLYCLENFSFNTALKVRWLKTQKDIKSIKVISKFDFQFNSLQKNGVLESNQFADVEICFTQPQYIFSAKLMRAVASIRQMAIENDSGTLVAIGIIK